MHVHFLFQIIIKSAITLAKCTPCIVSFEGVSFDRLKYQNLYIKISTHLGENTVNAMPKSFFFLCELFKQADKTKSQKCPKNQAVLEEPPLKSIYPFLRNAYSVQLIQIKYLFLRIE